MEIYSDIENGKALKSFELTGTPTKTTMRQSRRGRLAQRRHFAIVSLVMMAAAAGFWYYGDQTVPHWRTRVDPATYAMIALLVSVLPGLPGLLHKKFVSIDHAEQAIETATRKELLFEASEIGLKDNPLSETTNYYVFMTFPAKPRMILWEKLTRLEAIAFAKWLQRETGLNIRMPKE
jgi:hypothetical protein